MLRFVKPSVMGKYPSMRLISQTQSISKLHLNTNTESFRAFSKIVSEETKSKIQGRHQMLSAKNPLSSNPVGINRVSVSQTQHDHVGQKMTIRRFNSATSPFGGGSGGPMKNFHDRLYNAIADLAYQYPHLSFIPYVEGDRQGTLALTYLIALQIALYILLTYIFPKLRKHFIITQQNVLDKKFHVLLTHALYHTSILHLLINSYVLVSFGRMMIASKGLAPIAAIYLGGCLTGGLLTSISVTMTNTPVQAMGSSTGIFALFTYAALLNPHLQAGIIFLPISVSLLHIWYAALAFELFRFLGFQSPAAAGHLGGAIGGAAAVLLRV